MTARLAIVSAALFARVAGGQANIGEIMAQDSEGEQIREAVEKALGNP